MIINSDNLNKLRVGFNASYQRGLDGTAAKVSSRITTRVTATQKEQRYGWLGKMPNVREWIGDRVVQSISESDYSIKEKKWELTVGVDAGDIQTDNLGQYNLLFEGIGESAGSKPEQLVWDLLVAGFSTNCYDGQYFFDTDHPVLDANGAPLRLQTPMAALGGVVSARCQPGHQAGYPSGPQGLWQHRVQGQGYRRQRL
jgi:phage major head subunit gpT-like protein